MCLAEMNFIRLLHRTEDMAAANRTDSLRFHNYLLALKRFFNELLSSDTRPPVDYLHHYECRIKQLEAARDLATSANSGQHVLIISSNPMIPRPIVDDRLTLWSHTLSTSPTSRVDSNKETDSELTYRPTSIRGFVDDAPNILRHEQQHAYVEKRRQLLGSGLDEETLNQNGDRDSSKNSQAHVILEEELRREQLASSMIGMTRHLKDQSLAMSDRLQSDRKTVEDSIVQTTKNQATLSVVMNQLSEELGSRCARTVWIALFLSLILFFQMIAFMKIFRRRSRWYYGTARTEL